MARLFGTSGVRGVFPEKVNPELMVGAGKAVAQYFGKGSYGVGHDARTTSKALCLALASGIMSSGSSVVDVGLVPIGVFAWSVRHLKLRGGVYVTASHNPPQYNGFKVFKEGGVEVTSEDEAGLEVAISRATYAGWADVGGYVKVEVVDDYVRSLEGFLQISSVRFRPRIVLDTANGPVSAVAPRVMTDMKIPNIVINGSIDGRFPGRHPEPRPDVLEPLVPLLRASGYDVMFAFDGDGDRLSIVTPRQGFVKQDRVIALFALHVLKDRKGTVVVSVDCGNSVKKVVEGMGGRLVLHKLGKTHEGLLRYGNVVLAAEPWKVIDPRWGPWIDAVYQAVYIAKLMMEEGKDMDQLLLDVPNYPQARYSVTVPEELKTDVFSDICSALKAKAPEGAEITEIDGTRVDYEDGSWILVRASGTEPKIRLYAESPELSRLKQIVDEFLGMVTRSLAARGAKPESVEGSLLP